MSEYKIVDGYDQQWSEMSANNTNRGDRGA